MLSNLRNELLSFDWDKMTQGMSDEQVTDAAMFYLYKTHEKMPHRVELSDLKGTGITEENIEFFDTMVALFIYEMNGVREVKVAHTAKPLH